MDSPLISIVLIVYNGYNIVENAIKSVITQEYNNIEFIIIDGGSADGTIEIIKKYEKEISYWVSEQDFGIYDAINKGIDKIKGDWVLFLGCDDTLFNVLHLVAKRLKDVNTIYYGDAYMCESEINYAGKFNMYKIACKNICHQAIFYPRNLFNYYKYSLEYRVHSDYELNLKAFVDKRFCFEYVNQVISAYSEKGFSTYQTDEFYEKNRFEILKNTYPPLVFYYAKLRFWGVKIIKRKLLVK